MKPSKERLTEALKLVDENAPYVVYFDGQVIDQRLNEGVVVQKGNLIDGSTIYPLKTSELEKNINANLMHTSSLEIKKNMTITLIHMGEDQKYLGYNLVVGEGVEATIHNIYLEMTGEANLKFDLLCKRNSVVTFKNISKFSENTTSLVHAYCYNQAYIKIDDFAINNKEVQSFTDVVLLEEHAQVHFNNVAINDSGVKQSYKYNVFHADKNTTSSIMNYGISKSNSFLVFDNTGTITKGSSNSVMNQKTRGIILDLYSSISANPILVIDESDVVANHGASIGAIDEGDLFYLMSRGLPQEESVSLIVHGFIAPYFKDLKNESIHEYLISETAKHL